VKQMPSLDAIGIEDNDGFKERYDEIAAQMRQKYAAAQGKKPADAQSLTSWLASQKKTKIIAVYNFKGGVGKTTLCVNTAAALAEAGKRILMVDADAQTNLTSFFMPPQPSEDDNDDADPPPPPIQAAGTAVFERVDRIRPKAKLLAPDFKIFDNSIFAYNKIDDINEALAGPLQRGGAEFMPPAKYFCPLPLLYQDRLLMIPGSARLFEYESTLAKSRGEMDEILKHNALGNLVRMAAYVVDADYVFIDLGPSSSYLNKVILMSCDYILPPVFADLFSLGSLHNLLHVMLPDVVGQMEYLKGRAARLYANPSPDRTLTMVKAYGYTYSAAPPTILPFIVTNYRKKGSAEAGPSTEPDDKCDGGKAGAAGGKATKADDSTPAVKRQRWKSPKKGSAGADASTEPGDECDGGEVGADGGTATKAADGTPAAKRQRGKSPKKEPGDEFDGGMTEADHGTPAAKSGNGLLKDPEEDSFGPEWVTNAPGKFIAAMQDLLEAFTSADSATEDEKTVKNLMKTDIDNKKIIPLIRSMPKLMSESMETGVPAVSMTRAWWEGTIKPQMTAGGLKAEFPSTPELHQLVSDHIYTKVRMKMLCDFLESL